MPRYCSGRSNTTSTISSNGNTPSAPVMKNTVRQLPVWAAIWVARILAHAGVRIHAHDRRACAWARPSLLNQRIRIRADGTYSVPINMPNRAIRKKYSYLLWRKPIQKVMNDHETPDKIRIFLAPYLSVSTPEIYCDGP